MQFPLTLQVLKQTAYQDSQYAMVLQMPELAEILQAGQVILFGMDDLDMLPALPILDINRKQGTVTILYRIEDSRWHEFNTHPHRAQILEIGGIPFQPITRSRLLFLGEGLVTANLIFFIRNLLEMKVNFHPLLLWGNTYHFPFKPQPSQILVSGMPQGVIASIPLLEDLKIASRLAYKSLYDWEELPGCFEGTVIDLATHWLNSLSSTEQAELEIITVIHPDHAAILTQRFPQLLIHHYIYENKFNLHEFW